MRVLFVTTEMFPFVKTGGLADVSSAIPRYLADKGLDVHLFMPLYMQIDQEMHGIESTGERVEFTVATRGYLFEIYSVKKNGVTIRFLHNPYFFNRKKIYGSYFDNELRFGIFCYAVAEYMKKTDMSPEVVHLNDWQSAILALLLKEKYDYHGKVIFLIHNFAYQGIFEKNAMNRLELDWKYFKMDILEHYDHVNFLKAGVAFSDSVVAVSKGYAKEICDAEFGGVLSGFMKHYEYKLVGIQNGLDTKEFDPQRDPYIFRNYSKESLSLRAENKAGLCAELGIKGVERPLFGFLGRLVHQKGIEFILGSLEHLVRFEANFVFLGDGEGVYADMFLSFINKFDNIFPILGYNEALARKIYAGADFIMMPSTFEPSGLNQLIAMRYGAVPVVRKCGGLNDTVCDYLEDEQGVCGLSKGVGVTFDESSTIGFMLSVMRGYGLYQNKEKMQEIIKRNLEIDFSWESRIMEYIELYKNLDKSAL